MPSFGLIMFGENAEGVKMLRRGRNLAKIAVVQHNQFVTDSTDSENSFFYQ